MTANTNVHTCSYYCERPECVRRQRDELRDQMELAHVQQPAAVNVAKETDLWRCTVCGRFGAVGRCCGEETRERANMEQLLEENDRLRAEVERLREAASAVQGEPVAYIRQEDFEFILADDKSEPYGTRQAPVFSRNDCRTPVPLYALPQPPAQDVETLLRQAK